MKAAQQIKILESYKGKEESLPKIEIGKLLQISLIVYGAIEKTSKRIRNGKMEKVAKMVFNWQVDSYPDGSGWDCC